MIGLSCVSNECKSVLRKEFYLSSTLRMVRAMCNKLENFTKQGIATIDFFSDMMSHCSVLRFWWVDEDSWVNFGYRNHVLYISGNGWKLETGNDRRFNESCFALQWTHSQATLSSHTLQSLQSLFPAVTWSSETERQVVRVANSFLKLNS